MPWWASTLVGTVITVSVAFWGWLAVKVIDQGRKLVELESRIQARERECGSRLEWLRSMDAKLATACEGIAGICGKLGVQTHEQ